MSSMIAMVLFSFAMSITPGPVNFVILSSSMSFGTRSTLRFVSGATIGFTLLLGVISFGLYTLVEGYPAFLDMLAVIGGLYILYIGYKIGIDRSESNKGQENPPKFFQGFLLQWLNPKAWGACVAGVSLFASQASYLPLVLFVCIYFAVCFLCLAAWAIAGGQIAELMRSERVIRTVNQCMGILLAATAVYLMYAQLVLGRG